MTTTNTTTAKLTNKTALLYAKALVECQPIPAECEGFTAEAVAEKLSAQIAQLEKKNANKTPNKNAAANAEYREIIAAFFAECAEHLTASEILKRIPALRDADLSNQRVSRILNDMHADGVLDKATEKRKSVFFAVAE